MTALESCILIGLCLIGMYGLFVAQRTNKNQIQSLIQSLNVMSEAALENKLNALSYRASELLDRTEERLRTELISHRERLYHASTQQYNQQMETQKHLRESMIQSYSRLREDILARLAQTQDHLTTRQTTDLKNIRELLIQRLNEIERVEQPDEFI